MTLVCPDELMLIGLGGPGTVVTAGRGAVPVENGTMAGPSVATAEAIRASGTPIEVTLVDL